MESKYEILLEDLKARLEYGVILNCFDIVGETLKDIRIIDGKPLINGDWDIEEVKPYLRPISDMSESETKEYNDLCKTINIWLDLALKKKEEVVVDTQESLNWLDKNMFDRRGLIPLGLAIKVTDEVNPYKNDKKRGN